MAFVLPRLQQSVQIVDDNGKPSYSFHVWWDQFAQAIENALNSIQTQVADIAAAQAAAAAAQSTANTAVTNAAAAQSTANTAQSTATTAQLTATTANTNAAAAQNTADLVHVNDSISSSWTSPGTILSASDAGTSATITVSTHSRKYNDATSKSVTGSSITGLAYSTTYYVYYDDSSRSGGSVTFNATTNPNTALPGAAAGRHYCGDITTPASGGGSTSGGVSPPGSGGQIGGGQVP